MVVEPTTVDADKFSSKAVEVASAIVETCHQMKRDPKVILNAINKILESPDESKLFELLRKSVVRLIFFLSH
jgi:hypothetical protein